MRLRIWNQRHDLKYSTAHLIHIDNYNVYNFAAISKIGKYVTHDRAGGVS